MAANEGMQEFVRHHIDFTAEGLGQFIGGADNRQPRRPALLELIQHIDIAIGLEVITQNRAEQPEPPDVPLAAEFGQDGRIYIDFDWHFFILELLT